MRRAGLDRSTLAVAAVATLGLIMAALDTTIVNVAPDTLSSDLHHPRKEHSMSTTTTTTAPVLEPAAQAFAEATADPPFLFDVPPSEGRALVDELQSGEIAKPDVDEQ